MKISIAISIFIATSSSCNAFLNLPFINKANPALTTYAEAQEDILLKIHLDIGEVKHKRHNQVTTPTGQRLGIDGLYVQLGSLAEANHKHPKLPGANGPNPQLSSGAYKLETLRDGKFVDLAGTQCAKFDSGAFELIWRNNAKAGAFILAMNVPQEIKRNDAKIPSGRVYLTFPVYSEESLKHLKERKEKAEEVANEAMERLKNESAMMEQTDNPIMKALHFRQACKAHEDLDYSGYRSYKSMPLDKEMVELKGLHVCSVGTLWTKDENVFGSPQTLLGSASMMLGDISDLAEKKEVARRNRKPTAYDGLDPDLLLRP